MGKLHQDTTDASRVLGRCRFDSVNGVTTRGPGKEANWLPAPAGAFYMYVRNYAPSPKLTESLRYPATVVGPPGVVAVEMTSSCSG